MQSTRRRISSPAWLALGLVLAMPALAEAQLFPNRTITRQKEACAAEPPFYSTVRRNFYGYYPTCWSKFPAGWGCPCPNPELPNAFAAFNERPRDKFEPLTNDENTDGMEGEENGPLPRTPNPDDAGMPPVPNAGRSPFNAELNPPPDTTTPKPLTDPANPPQTSRAPASGSRAQPAASANPTPDQPITTGLLEMPRITPPTAAPSLMTEPSPDAGKITLAPDATLTSTDAAPRSSLGPLPPAPMPDGSMPAISESINNPTVLYGPPPTASGTVTTPAQAPQRKGLLGGLFGGSKKRR